MSSGVVGVVVWEWRKLRLDLWSGLFLFGVSNKDGHGPSRLRVNVPAPTKWRGAFFSVSGVSLCIFPTKAGKNKSSQKVQKRILCLLRPG
jgi:hypothetical protein